MRRNTGNGGTLHCGGGVGCGGCSNGALLDGAATGIVVELLDTGLLVTALLARVLGTFVLVACCDVLASKLAMAGGSCVEACVVLAALVVVYAS